MDRKLKRGQPTAENPRLRRYAIVASLTRPRLWLDSTLPSFSAANSPATYAVVATVYTPRGLSSAPPLRNSSSSVALRLDPLSSTTATESCQLSRA